MKRLIMELLALFCASVISVAVVYFKIPSTLIQQAIAALVVILLVVSRIVSARNKTAPPLVSASLIVLISTLLQMLILSSGGFYSPFLILFYLFAIGLSFLRGVGTAIGFLAFSVSALIIGTILDGRLYGLFVNDPWSAVLILLSFVVVIPLFQLISSSYNLKEAVSRILTTELKMTSAQLELTKKKGELLLEGLSDLVIVTDLNLRILSVNEAAIRAFKLSSAESLGKPFFDVVYLKDMNGKSIDAQFLSISDVIASGTTHLISDLLLFTKNTSFPKKISLRIHPTRNLSGHIDQIVFIISNFFDVESPNFGYRNIEKAVLRHKSLLEEVRNELEGKNLKQLKTKIELLGETEEDILVADQITSHGIKPNFNLGDVANLMQNVVVQKKAFADGLGVSMEFGLSQEFTGQFTTIDIGRGRVVPVAFTSQYFTALIEPRWFDILMAKILDLSILLSIKKTSPHVKIFLSYDQSAVSIHVSCAYPAPVPQNFEESLLTEYYGSLGTDANMALGSGLEGYLIKTITTLMNIPFNITYQQDSQVLYLTIKLSKAPNQA